MTSFNSYILLISLSSLLAIKGLQASGTPQPMIFSGTCSGPETQRARSLFIQDVSNKRCIIDEIHKNYDCISQLHKCVGTYLKGDSHRHVLVTGGAGFVGSHLVDSLMLDGHRVTVWDDFSTGRRSNIEHWIAHENFELVELDVAQQGNRFNRSFDQIYHLAAPASPVHYMADPIKTINTIVSGSMNVLQAALGQTKPPRIVLASTSEIYGDPLVHPQTEDYWGNTNPVGPRSCYDEGKRLSESLASAYTRQHNMSIAMVRIFNTYGPRMHPRDGRVISNFVSQAIQNKSLTIYGTGNQTRSFQYVSDLISGLRALMSSDLIGPVNMGNPQEISITTLADRVKVSIPESLSQVEYDQLPVDDPSRRRPDIGRALKHLAWTPQVELIEGLRRTVEYFREELKD